MCPIKPRRRWAAMGSRWAHCNLSCARKCPHVPRWRFFQAFLAASFLAGPLDQVAPPPGGERNRTPCGGYGAGGEGGVSGPNCPKKEKAPFSKFPEKQKDLPSHH